jgi:aminopeptidase N
MTRILPTLALTALLHSTLFTQALFPVRDAGEAPDRTFDVLHYTIAVSIDEPARAVHGTVTTTLVPFPAELRTVVFDAEEMTITSATLGKGTPLKFSQQEKKVTLDLDRAYSHKDTLTVSIGYSCTPHKGLYFIQPDSAYPDRPRQIWSQGEDMDNHFWFPCYDFPNDRATSEMIATVPGDLTALSNGALIDVRENKAEHTKTFHWKESLSHPSYLITLAVGKYAIVKDKAGAVPLTYYVYPGQEADARICFRETPAMIRFFNEKTGLTYPWEKYAQILIHEFIEGGMENASATSLADDATVFDARARIDENPSSLIAHELSHQWWGDVVTCKDWRHLWLNEGFASYFDPLYHESTLGRDHFDVTMYEAQQSGINSDKTMGRKPIVSIGSYTANLYPRGASVLHMLRFVLGEEMFWRAMRYYIAQYRFTTVETNDLKTAIEESTGQNLYWFFDEWVYKAGYPVFAVSSDWIDSTHTVQVSVSQKQTCDSLTGIFRMPVDIEVTTDSGATTHRVWVDQQDTVYRFPAPSSPTMVIFDKGNWILKELKVTQSLDTWVRQAEQSPNPVDRLRALEHLGSVDDSATVVPVVIRRSHSDSSPAVRREAVQMLGLMTGGTAPVRQDVKHALLDAVNDTDASVRTKAVPFLTDSGDAEIITTLHRVLKDSSYIMVARALRALSKADPSNATQILIDHLDMPSHRDAIASTALSALSGLDSVRGREEALRRVRYGNPQPVRGTALAILRRLAMRGKGEPSMFIPLLNDRNIWLRISALNALGECGEEGDLLRLDAIATDVKNPAANAARKAAVKVRTRIENR